MKIAQPKVVAVAAVAVVLSGVVAFLLKGAKGAASRARSSDAAERAAAAVELGEEDDPASREVLKRLCTDPEPKVAVLAVRALARSKRIESRRFLGELLRRSKRGRTRAACAAALGEFKQTDPAVLTSMLHAEQEPDAAVRAGAAKGLEALRSKAAIPALLAALDDPDAKVRLWAITALTRTVGGGIRFDYQPQETNRAARRRKIDGVRYLISKWGLMPGGASGKR